jgi:peptidoglycan hydrolase-like protein with peptidoglycan-binding domain
MAEPVLKRGSSDPAVRDLQQALKSLGYDPGSIDGVFGARTESAVKAFQTAREIFQDVGVTIDAAGAGVAANIPPAIVFNKIIKT